MNGQAKKIKAEENTGGREFALSIETTIEGGGVSLLDGGSEIDFWLGSKEVSKAEDVLEQIEKLLRKNNLAKKHIKKVFVSDGLGSLTGSKVGWAMARGLRMALDCEIACVSVLRSLLIKTELEKGFEYITALPRGKNQLICQVFRVEGKTNQAVPEPHRLLAFNEFLQDIESDEYKEIILHRKLYELCVSMLLARSKFDVSRLIDAGENLAFLNAVNPDRRFCV